MTFFEHANIAIAVVGAMGVLIAQRNRLRGLQLWALGLIAFSFLGLLFSFAVPFCERLDGNAARARGCTYRETPSALVIECPSLRKGTTP